MHHFIGYGHQIRALYRQTAVAPAEERSPASRGLTGREGATLATFHVAAEGTGSLWPLRSDASNLQCTTSKGRGRGAKREPENIKERFKGKNNRKEEKPGGNGPGR